jgi:elongation factor 1-gamma
MESHQNRYCQNDWPLDWCAGFWEMYDPEGYSLWFCDYKHNDENQVTFVTMNKVGGFLQRMDFIRKYAFSKMCILGESPPYSIKGVWLFRYCSPSHFANAKCPYM